VQEMQCESALLQVALEYVASEADAFLFSPLPSRLRLGCAANVSPSDTRKNTVKIRRHVLAIANQTCFSKSHFEKVALSILLLIPDFLKMT
jgi:hypothetical protein